MAFFLICICVHFALVSEQGEKHICGHVQGETAAVGHINNMLISLLRHSLMYGAYLSSACSMNNGFMELFFFTICFTAQIILHYLSSF